MTHLLGKVVKHWDVSPSDHVLSLEAANLFELWLLLCVRLLATGVLLVNGSEQFLEKDKVLSALEIVNLDVGEFGVDTEGQVRRKSVWGGCPSEERGRGIINQGERDRHCMRLVDTRWKK